MGDALLTINAGSSSIKFALFAVTGRAVAQRLVGGQIEGIGVAPCFVAHDGAGAEIGRRQWAEGGAATHEDVFGELLPWIERHLGDTRLIAVGHRVVHGGRTLVAPVLLTPAVVAELEALVPLAPLHQPHSLHAIRALAPVRPDLPQIACFDTAFHRAQPALSRRYALPRALSDAGIERYGFHGLS